MSSPHTLLTQAMAQGAEPSQIVVLFEQALTLGVDEEQAEAWLRVLAEHGELVHARACLKHIVDPARRAAVHERLERDVFHLTSAEDDELDGLDWTRPGAVDADAQTVKLFMRWFRGRPDLYARQWFDERRKRGGYHPVREPFDEGVARRHLTGRHTVGQYLLWPDNSVSFAVIDLDLATQALSALEERPTPSSRGALSHPGIAAYARTALAVAGRLGLPFFAEDSGAKGVHLWCFFEPRRPARAARLLLSRIVSAAGPVPPDVSVEVFPKQEHAGERGLSSLVKLPLGLHQRTLRRCDLLDPSLEPLTDIAAALTSLQSVPNDALDALLAHRLVALPAPELHPAHPLPALPSAPVPTTLAEALRGIAPGKAEREACDRMLDGCAVLRGIANEAFAQRGLSADAARGVIYTLGLISQAPSTARDLLVAAGVSTRELDRLATGLPSPAGCKRLRQLAPAGTCADCLVSQTAQPYATPTLLAVGETSSVRKRPAYASHLEAVEATVESPLDGIARALERIERRLKTWPEGKP